MTFRLTVVGATLSVIVLGSGAAVAASVDSNNMPTPPMGSTQSHASWSVTGNVTPIASPSVFKGGGSLFKTNFQLIKPYYYVVQGTKVGDHYQYPLMIKAQHGIAVVSIELQKNDANHTELFEVGVPTKQSLQKASHAPLGGSSASSSGSSNS